MKINIKYLLSAVGIGFIFAQIAFAFVQYSDQEPMNPILSSLLGIVAIIFFILAAFSYFSLPIVVYSWYIKRGGRHKWLGIFLFGLPLLAIVSFGSNSNFFLLGLLYLLLLPIVSYLFHIISGGDKFSFRLSILMILSALLIKGMVGITEGLLK
jgi:hypothetical protein